MSQNYGVLRVVRVLSTHQPTQALMRSQIKTRQGQYPGGRLPEEGLVHLLTRPQTTVGRALNNDVILMDPTVSREHARIVRDAQGWYITNLTVQNIVRVNGRFVPGGSSVALRPQDIIILGSTMLQLVAPHPLQSAASEKSSHLDADLERQPTQKLPSDSQFRPSERQPGIPIQWGRQPQASAPSKAPDSALLASSASTPFLASPRSDDWQSSATPPEQHALSALPHAGSYGYVGQPYAEFEDGEDVSLFGAGVTMQFALPQQLGVRTRWLIAGVTLTILLISAMITIILNVIGFSTLAQNGVTSVIEVLIIPLVPAIGISLLVNFIDRFEREPWFLRLAAFLWGAIIAIPPALFIEQNLDGVLQNLLAPDVSDVVRTALQGLNAGVTEETIKGLGLLLLFIILRDEFDNVTDGIVYGALIGAGFAMVENFAYFAQAPSHFLVFLIVGRIVLGWLGHSTFTACFGAALGYVRHTKERWQQIVFPLLGYFIAVGLHSSFDFVDFQASAAVQHSPGNSSVAFYSLIAIICNYVPPFLVQIGLLYILILALRHEAAIIREFLAAEVANGIVMVDEYALLQNSFHRTKEERRVLHRSGVRQWLRVKALYQTEIGLAFRKWHVHMGDKPKLGFIQPEDAYRQRIKRLRKKIRACEMRAKEL